MTIETELSTLLATILEREREIARSLIVREIQAFAGDYAHSMTKDNSTQDVIVVKQLIDFLNPPSAS